ncbi:helix-turn-helix transcriptional regulator [Micromonospora zamorensis]|uniref:helix-turn-helix transcriptional regulator n=1 Tax=Micromonospora zamorensis TaxID=709883 RepID=UPI0033F70528
MTERKPLADPRQVAAYLGVAEKTLRQWRYLKTGPKFTKVGGRIRYRWSDVEKYLDGDRGAKVA